MELSLAPSNRIMKDQLHCCARIFQSTRCSISQEAHTPGTDVHTPATSFLLTPREILLCQLVFILIGVSSMYYWNAVINVLYSVIVIRSPKDVITITNVYTSVAVVGAFLLSVFKSATKAHHYTGGLMLASMCILFPIMALYPSPDESSILLHIAGAIAGASEMLFQCSGFSFAVLLNKRFAGYVSFGYGACGVLTFLLWMLLTQVCFPKEPDGTWKSKQMGRAIWAQFAVGFILIVSSMIATSAILELPQMKHALRLAQKDVAFAAECQDGAEMAREFFAVPSPCHETDSVYLENLSTKKESFKASASQGGGASFHQSSSCELLVKDHQRQEQPQEIYHPQLDHSSTQSTSSDGWLKKNSKELWHIFTRTWQLQIGLGLCQGISMMAYPLIGPYQFRLTTQRNDILTGIFQCGDFLGRYIPNLSVWIPFLLIPSRWMLSLTLMRLVVLALFILTARAAALQEDGQLMPSSILTRYGTMITLMAALALTHGYYGSVFMIRMTESLQNPQHKVRASAMAVCLLVACIAIGMWLARLVHF